MYRILTFLDYTWSASDVHLDCLEDALVIVNGLEDIPWRIQEWIDIRNGPAEAGFWHDVEWWLDGREYRATTERMT